ncbi:MAG: hypothetical protein JWL72_2680 [Ilumatobacteraceae bacterium]|nr:hypothetical protein [Ilumatobacteraceae bacterium]MCU1389342.1 hypothetical protein [Ilumatobacteraceae bacterium]
MVLLAVGLAVLFVGATAFAVATLMRLKRQRLIVAEAEEAVSTRSRELAAKGVALERAERLRAEAGERADAAEQAQRLAELDKVRAEYDRSMAEQDRMRAEHARAAADDERAKARRAAAIAEASIEQSRLDAERAINDSITSEERAAAAERRAAEASAIGVDPHVLWALERSRVERRWKLSVTMHPDRGPLFADAPNALVEALQVELDAIREEVGTVVALAADLPPTVTAAGSLLTLRATQELLASVVRRADTIKLRVFAEVNDIVVMIEARDERGQLVEPLLLATPPSLGLEASPGGVRILDAIAD